MKAKKETILDELHLFTGTENWYQLNSFSSLKITDGCKYIAETCGAYWLFDLIAAIQTETNIRPLIFQEIRLQTDLNLSSAVLTVTDGNKNEFYRQNIEFTDFPLESIRFYLRNDVIMLPTEY